jgi:cell division protein FtsB
MEQQEYNKSDYQEQGPRKGIVIIVITILLGTNGLLLWQFFEKKNSLDDANKAIYSTAAERDALQEQLKKVKADFDRLITENSDLKEQLVQSEEMIRQKAAKIQELINLGGPAQIQEAKRKLAELKGMNSRYEAQLDSLGKVAAMLQAENQNLNSDLTKARSMNNRLSDQNTLLSSKVAVGSILKALNLATEGVRYRPNGDAVATTRAKSVQKIRTKFTLAENRVIDKGPIDLYVRVIGPDGGVMTSMQDVFTSGGQSLTYTLKETVNYDNKDTPVEISWARGTQFAVGTYTVEIYQSGAQIGRSAVTLK